ncbi:hypothetical protein N0V85_001649 [Neurospora sp. IMI 360204]|nr:hypothetical protein N0V85_001649 [Neurospora sp. IMI 360204]
MAARPHVEARSLSTLNSLAANPPQYPHSADVKESLTLYISRVPGSRDVILSPFRPHRKNVTVEDINNALYLIHLDLPTDELLVDETSTAVSPRTSGESARSVIPRKPLPPSARVEIPTPRQPPATASATQNENNAPKNTGPVPTRSPSVRRTGSVRRPQAPGTERVERAVAAQAPVAGNDGYRQNPMFQPSPVSEPPSRPALQLPPPAENLAAMRRPFGPRPQTALTIPEEPPISPGTTTPTNNRPITPTDQTLYTPTSNIPRPGDGILSPPTVTRARAPSNSKLAATIPFTLTLIRRDPSTNLQWNVGKISSFETNIPTPESAHPDLGEPHHDASTTELPPPIATQLIDVHLETSGYAKYRGMPSRANIEALRPTSPQSFARTLQGLGTGSGTTNGNGSLGSLGSSGSPQKQIMGVAHREVEEGFHRQVVMAYTKSWTSGFKGAFKRHSRSGSASATVGDLPGHARHGSSSTIGSADISPNEHQTPQSPPRNHNRQESMGGGQLITQPGPNLRPKGYVFLSPWLGRCEFRTGSTGRSLKCRHILDEHTGGITQIDPAKLAQSVRDAPTIGQSRGDSLSSAITGAKPVSELRFNLPSEPRSPGAGGENSTQTGSKRHRFTKFLGIEPPSSEDEYFDDEDIMDSLALGREDAGGGSRGKRAKLGKLIIHDEGLKMLDLVVAANMGVWWNTWEKRF